ncbi:hypothetical protein BU17DRAFT_60525 [Hysterangium stoloniferum]|nr:hypothetical protein BU17DRAFT_60525 [Hysterangium stoloniferum]
MSVRRHHWYIPAATLTIILVWPLPRSLGRTLYFINSYLVFINVILSIIGALVYRTWIIWQRSKTILILLLVLATYTGTCAIALAAISLGRTSGTVPKVWFETDLQSNQFVTSIAPKACYSQILVAVRRLFDRQHRVLLVLTYYKAKELCMRITSVTTFIASTNDKNQPSVLYYVYMLADGNSNAKIRVFDYECHSTISGATKDRGDLNFTTPIDMLSRYRVSEMEGTYMTVDVGVLSSVVFGGDEWRYADSNVDPVQNVSEDENVEARITHEVHDAVQEH